MNWNDRELRGEIHFFIAWDWSEELRLDDARRLSPTETQSLPRRRRTPASVAYSPAPLLYSLPSVQLNISELGLVDAAAEATVFDFGGISVSFRIPFVLKSSQLLNVADSLGGASAIESAARRAAEPLYETLQVAMIRPNWTSLTEEYVVFRIDPNCCPDSIEELLTNEQSWLAQLTRLEKMEHGRDEIEMILATRISYGHHDLFLPEWTASLLIDSDCEETLQTIEFTNLQLLEYRFLDNLVDQRLGDAYRLIQPLAKTWLPFLKVHDRPLRALGELRVDAHSLFERTSNALKLMGDQYLARVYRMLAERFHLSEWSKSIEKALDTVESTYQVISDQAATYRTEFLEIVVIVLIFIEIVLGFVRH